MKAANEFDFLGGTLVGSVFTGITGGVGDDDPADAAAAREETPLLSA